jgi:hypothetical protein
LGGKEFLVREAYLMRRSVVEVLPFFPFYSFCTQNVRDPDSFTREALTASCQISPNARFDVVMLPSFLFFKLAHKKNAGGD